VARSVQGLLGPGLTNPAAKRNGSPTSGRATPSMPAVRIAPADKPATESPHARAPAALIARKVPNGQEAE